MKNLILGVALVAAVAACKSQTNSSVSSAEGAAVTDCKSSCSGAAKTECAGQAKTECGGAKTCPATGKTMN